MGTSNIKTGRSNREGIAFTKSHYFFKSEYSIQPLQRGGVRTCIFLSEVCNLVKGES